jgi:hypothetical protein
MPIIKQSSQNNEVNWDDPLNKGLVAWYPMRQKGGNVLRDVAGENHGTLESSMTGDDWVPSPETKSLALDFDGVNDYVDCGTGTFGILPGSHEMTLSVWCKIGTFEDFPALLSKTNGTSPYGGWQLNVESTGRFSLGFNRSGSWTTLNTSSVFDTNEWYLVTATRRNDGHSIFVNGTLEGQGSGFGTIEYSNAADPVLVGRNGARGETLDGQVSDVRIYNRALSESEVHDLYVASRTGYQDQFKRRYFPVSTAIEDPPVEETSGGLIRLKSPRQTQPSYKTGYAKSASESAHPELWDGLRGAWVPALGNSGDVHNIVDKTVGTSNSLTWGPNHIDLGAAGYIDVGSKDYFAAGEDCSVFWHERINEVDTLYAGRLQMSISGSSFDFRVIRTDAISYQYLTLGPTPGTGVSRVAGAPSIASSVGIWNSFLITSSDPSSVVEADYRCFVNGQEKAVLNSSDFGASAGSNKIGFHSSGQEPDCDISVFCIWDRRLTPDEAKILAVDPLAPFRQRRTAIYSTQATEPPLFNHWYALPSRIHRIIGSGVNF